MCNIIRPIVYCIPPVFSHMLWSCKTGLSWIQNPVHQNMSIIRYLWTGEACWWTIHPASKQRSEGEKVRVGDDLILVSVSSERYLVSHYEPYLALQIEFLCHYVLSQCSFMKQETENDQDLIFLYSWLPRSVSVTQQNVSALSLWICLCPPFFSSLLSSTCPMEMIACMWTQHSSRPSGVWPPSAQEARLHKVEICLTKKQTFLDQIQFYFTF